MLISFKGTSRYVVIHQFHLSESIIQNFIRIFTGGMYIIVSFLRALQYFEYSVTVYITFIFRKLPNVSDNISVGTTFVRFVIVTALIC